MLACVPSLSLLLCLFLLVYLAFGPITRTAAARGEQLLEQGGRLGEQQMVIYSLMRVPTTVHSAAFSALLHISAPLTPKGWCG